MEDGNEWRKGFLKSIEKIVVSGLKSKQKMFSGLATERDAIYMIIHAVSQNLMIAGKKKSGGKKRLVR
uniref:Transposase n=1 Tax=Syphacia muris TaxID=451379 RepID=A0A0N5B079_9BILA